MMTQGQKQRAMKHKKIIEEYCQGSSLREVAISHQMSHEGIRRIISSFDASLLREVGNTKNNSTGLTSMERTFWKK